MLTIHRPSDRRLSHFSGRWLGAAALTVAMLVACSGSPDSTSGTAVDQTEYRVGGLLVVEGPSGLRDDAPPPRRDAGYGDGGPVDALVLAAVEDVEMFWQQPYPEASGAPFEPVDELVSYDSLDPSSPEVCDIETYDMPNAIKFGFMPPALASPWRHHTDNVQIESGQALLFRVCRPDDTASYALKRLKNSDRVRDSNARSTPCEQ